MFTMTALAQVEGADVRLDRALILSAVVGGSVGTNACTSTGRLAELPTIAARLVNRYSAMARTLAAPRTLRRPDPAAVGRLEAIQSGRAVRRSISSTGRPRMRPRASWAVFRPYQRFRPRGARPPAIERGGYERIFACIVCHLIPK